MSSMKYGVLAAIGLTTLMGSMSERQRGRAFSVGPEPCKRTGEEVEAELQRIVEIRRAKQHKRSDR